MSLLETLAARLGQNVDLEEGEIASVAALLAAPGEDVDSKANFLSALARKGETAAELAAFAREFRRRAVDPGVGEWSAGAIDIVGTGGDHAGGFNISSVVVLVLASAGMIVMKHGNRGITSKCGSADLMAAFGVDLHAPPEKMRQSLRELGYVFFFAPDYHPAFQYIQPVRRALAARGERSVFNLLGPLINPGRPAYVLLGVPALRWVDALADASTRLGSKSGLVVHGVLGPNRGIDEFTTASANRVRGIGALRELSGDWNAETFGLTTGPFAELQGGDLAANLAITDALLDGRGPPGLADTVILNAALALWIAGKIAEVRDGLEIARQQLLGGGVKRKIAATREFFRA